MSTWCPRQRGFHSEPLPGEDVDEHEENVGVVGREFSVAVEYFDDPPKPVNVVSAAVMAMQRGIRRQAS